VPPHALWAGVPDGGSYIWCDVDGSRNVNHCTVWNDRNDLNGSVMENGEYSLLRENRATTQEELQFRWADGGGWICLRDDKVLDNLNLKHPR
jgi:hypothetical protein